MATQPYHRVFNFSAGPSTLPVEVLEQIRDEMLNWNGSGMSVLEMSHRGKVYEGIHAETQATLREIMEIPDNYKVLFIQGGATLQNVMVPMNLIYGGDADYIVTGTWGAKTAKEATTVGRINRIYDDKANGYRSVPNFDELDLTPRAAYVHFVTNETIQGVEFKTDPVCSNILVGDVSSNVLSRPIDVSKYGLLYGGAQKNQGGSGVATVIIRDDLLARTPEGLSPMLDYREYANNDSMPNTPPTFAIYVCGLVYKWVKGMGGTTAMQARNEAKAKLIYDAVDNSNGFYKGHADLNCRSLMNITFNLGSEDLTNAFAKEATTHGLDGLKGHRSVGGIRASVYNAFPPEGCQVLADFMADFAKRNG